MNDNENTNINDVHRARLEKAISNMAAEPGKERLSAVMDALHVYSKKGGSLLIPIDIPQALSGLDPTSLKPGEKIRLDGQMKFGLRKLRHKDGSEALVAFTSREQVAKGQQTSTLEQPAEVFLKAAAGMEGLSGVILNPWGEPFYLPKELLALLLDRDTPRSRICFDIGDITRLDCDCIVNAANESLLGGGGVDGAIHRAAGSQLLEECRTLDGCKTGQAKITGGYELKARYVIHTVGPVYSGAQEDAKLLSACCYNSLELAKANDIHTIAIPAISTGAYGYPIEKAVVVSLATVSRWLNDNKEYGMTVIMSCYNQETFGHYKRFLEEAKKRTTEDGSSDESVISC